MKRALVHVALVLASGCTFGGLGDYDVAECDPAAKTQSEDLCNRITPVDGCTPYQCDATSKRCVARTRDDDRDGDPPISCGGTE